MLYIAPQHKSITNKKSIMNTEFQNLLAPMQEINTIAVQNVEKFVDIQFKALEENTKVGLEQFKNASDLDGLKNYFSTQAEVSKKVAERAAKDTQAVVELASAYSSDLQRIVKANLPASAS